MFYFDSKTDCTSLTSAALFFGKLIHYIDRILFGYVEGKMNSTDLEPW